MRLTGFLRQPMLALLGGCALVLSSAPSFAYSALYVFGDSLSDAGNVYDISGGRVPPFPYVGGHFSNGPTWAEDLSGKLGLGTLKPSTQGGTDYAYGYATTSANIPRSSPVPLGLNIPNIEQQVATYSATHGFKADSSALYAVWIGSNDVLNALAAVGSGTLTPGQAEARVGAAISSEISAIGTLVQEGAKHLLIGLLPDLGLTPALNTTARDAGTIAASAYNAALETAASTYFPGVDLHFLNTFGLLQSAVASPSDYGFTDVTTPCFTGTSVCSNPDQHLFWDDLHPTRAGHELIADLAVRTLGVTPVPLPGSATLFAASLALLGALAAAGRRAKRVAGSVTPRGKPETATPRLQAGSFGAAQPSS